MQKKVYKNATFRNKIGKFEEPRHSESIFGDMCYLYRRTRQITYRLR